MCSYIITSSFSDDDPPQRHACIGEIKYILDGVDVGLYRVQVDTESRESQPDPFTWKSTILFGKTCDIQGIRVNPSYPYTLDV